MLERLQRKHRELTQFMCSELLYDYLNQRLDEDRRAGVESFVAAHPDMAHEIRAIQEGEKYCGVLAQTRISPQHIAELKAIRMPTENIMERLRWKNLPDVMKWTAEAFVLSVVVASLALFIPWAKIRSMIPDMPKIKRQAIVAEVVPAEQSAKPKDPKALPDEKAMPAPKAPEAVAKTELAKDEKGKSPVAKVEAVAGSLAVVDPASVTTVPVVIKGELYRLAMRVPVPPNLSDDVRDKILALGGEKAGQVDLGWRKMDPPGSYYHFKIPEAGYAELVTYLKALGAVEEEVSPHERVMKRGVRRVILWIEDGGSASATASPDEKITPTDNAPVDTTNVQESEPPPAEPAE